MSIHNLIRIILSNYKMVVIPTHLFAGTFFGYFYWRPFKHTVSFFIEEYTDSLFFLSAMGIIVICISVIGAFFVASRFYFICALIWVFNGACLFVLPLPPAYNFKLFYFLLIIVLIIVLWSIRCYGAKSIYDTILAIMVLLLLFISIFSFLIWLVGKAFEEPLINVINPGHFSNVGYPAVAEMIKQFKPFINNTIWPMFEIYRVGVQANAFPSSLPFLHGILEEQFLVSFLTNQVYNFYMPAPIKINSNICNIIMHFYVTGMQNQVVLLPYSVVKCEFLTNMLVRYNTLFVYTKPFLSFLSSRNSTELLFLSLSQVCPSAPSIVTLAGLSYSHLGNYFVISPLIAQALQAANCYSFSHQISLFDYFSLLRLLAGSIKPYSFSHLSALHQFYGGIYFRHLFLISIFCITFILNLKRLKVFFLKLSSLFWLKIKFI